MTYDICYNVDMMTYDTHDIRYIHIYDTMHCSARLHYTQPGHCIHAM